MSFPLSTAGIVGVALPYFTCEDQWTDDTNKQGIVEERRLVRKMIIPYVISTWRSYVPLVGAALPDYPWMTFFTAKCSQIKGDALRAELTLEYRQTLVQFDLTTPGADLPDSANSGLGGQAGQLSAGFSPLPESYYDETAGTLREAIDLHPKFDFSNPAWSASMRNFWDAEQRRFAPAAPDSLYTISDYLVGTFTTTLNEFSYAKLASPQGFVGKIKVPPSYTGDKTNWLIMSGARTRRAGIWQRSLIFGYNANGGDAFKWIYDTAP